MKKNKTGREEQRQEALKRLEIGVRKIQDSNSFKEFLKLASRFHGCSWRNWMLIFMQYPSATRVAGYRAWSELGHQVRKGESGIRILAPIVRRSKDDDNDVARAAGGQQDLRLKPLYLVLAVSTL